MVDSNGQRSDLLGEVYDLDAVPVDADEIPPFRFATAGHAFTFKSMDDLPWQAQRVLIAGDIEAMLRLLLAPDDWDEFEAIALPLSKVKQLMDAWGRHYGFDPGEAEASPNSSRTTARPSKRTSGRTTASGSRTSRRAR